MSCLSRVCFTNFDTNPSWGYNEETKRPYLRTLDLSTLTFTAEEINAYIDLIGETIELTDRYYIKKASEMFEYCSDSEKSNVKVSELVTVELIEFTNSVYCVFAFSNTDTLTLDLSESEQYSNISDAFLI